MVLKAAPNKITEHEISSIEHNHELRNNLYHEGIGISVNKEIVKSYSEEIISFISKLYEVDLSNLVRRLEIFRYIKKLNVLKKEWRKIELSFLIFILDFDIDPYLTIEERIFELASKGIISNFQKDDLINIFNFIQIINSKTAKITFQELDRIDEFIIMLRDMNAFFKSIADKKKSERRNLGRRKIQNPKA